MINFALHSTYYTHAGLKTPEVSDVDLIEQIKRRDEEALSKLYDRYRVDVYSLALHITHSTMLADEVTQDTFMKVWMHAARYIDVQGRFRSWLLVITRRAAIDVLRREYRTAGCYLGIDSENYTPVFEGVIDMHAEAEASWREMYSILEHLPTEQRQVIDLSFYGGLSQCEMAEHLGVPLGTIKTRSRLAMNKLREVFHRT